MNKECLVYLEECSFSESVQNNGNRLYNYNSISIDFFSEEDLQIFLDSTPPGLFASSEFKEVSFLEIQNYVSNIRLVADRFYNLDLTKFNALLPCERSKHEAAAFAYRIKLNEGNNSPFLSRASNTIQSQLTSSQNVNPIPANVNALYKNCKNYQINRVRVLNVSQGNWNELLCNKDVMVVYDIGGYKLSKPQNSIILWNTHKTKYKPDCTSLVLSHWDLDHYVTLCSVSEVEIKARFKAFFYPDLPISRTATILLSKINRALKWNCYPIQIPKPMGRSISVKPYPSSGCIQMYTGELSSGSNLSGIQIYVEGNNKNCLLTGDCNYRQVRAILEDQVIKSNITSGKALVLVVPHHGAKVTTERIGGKDVDIDISISSSLRPTFQMVDSIAIISVDEKNNSHGHPRKHTKVYLENKSSVVKRTDELNKDIEVNL